MRRAGGGEPGAILEDPRRVFLFGEGRQRERRGARESETGRGASETIAGRCAETVMGRGEGRGERGNDAKGAGDAQRPRRAG